MKSQVKAKWIVKLNKEADIKVKEGDRVGKGYLLAKNKISRVKSYDLSSILSKFDAASIKLFKNKWLGKEVEAGEILWATRGLFATKISSPSRGVILEIDEFLNLLIDQGGSEENDIVSPVSANVAKAGEEKIVLEFSAIEFKGFGLNELKNWGESDFKIIDRIQDLTVKDEGKIVFISNITRPLILKAEVVGVAGIVTVTKPNADTFGKIDFRLPILSLEEDKWDQVIREFTGSEKRVLINAKIGRLLVVSE